MFITLKLQHSSNMDHRLIAGHQRQGRAGLFAIRLECDAVKSEWVCVGLGGYCNSYSLVCILMSHSQHLYRKH